MDGVYLLLLGSVFFVLAGVGIERLNFFRMVDFKEFYFGSRLLIEHQDPYVRSNMLAIYQREATNLPSEPCPGCWHRSTDGVTPNFPTTFFLVAPLAVLPWNAAEIIWLSLISGCFILASFLAWNVAAEFAPRASAALIFLFLVNSELLLAMGNSAGVAIGFTVIATWCFLRNRFALAGAVCLAVALVMKPHDAGLVWLYFLIAGGALRKRAWQTLGLAAVLALPALLWTASVAPNWLHQLLANQAVITSHGGIDDPGPASMGNFGANMIINLQTVVSRIWDNPSFYNPVVYVICGAMLLLWLRKALRPRATEPMHWFALAAIAPLTVLFVYHRCYDARLLLLGMPAFATLWKRGGKLAWLALALNLVAILFTGDLFWILLFHFTHYSGPSVTYEYLPAPLALVALCIFYLYVYLGPAERCSGLSEVG
jgi:hypothetical protein